MDGANAAESVIRASVDAFNRHDLDGCLAFFDPEGSWEVVGMGQILTPEEVRILFWQYFLRDIRLDVRTLLASGNRVVTEFIQSHTNDDGRRVSAPLACVYELAAGRVVRVRQYYHPTWERKQNPAG